MPTVSVIVPCFNAALWIRDSLQSVAAQGLEDVEVIVVDDGSTDQTGGIVKEEFPFARLVQTDHRGPSYARNLGTSLASSQFIQYLDADDLLHPQKLEIQAKQILASPEAAVVYSDWQRYALLDRAWQPTGPVEKPFIDEDAVAGLLSAQNFLPTGSWLIRKVWLEKIGGCNDKLRIIEDVDLLLRLAMAGGRFRHTATGLPLFWYRQREDSLSRLSSKEFIEGCVRNACSVEEFWRSRGNLTPRRIRALTEVYFQAARFFAATDSIAFEGIVNRIEQMDKRSMPPGPPILRWLASLVGYRHAEQLALRYKTAKRLLRPGAFFRSR